MQTDNIVWLGDCRKTLPLLYPNTVQCCVTSPPYMLLRQYGESPDEVGHNLDVREYVKDLVGIFAHVYKALTPTGSLWINIGDKFANPTAKGTTHGKNSGRSGQQIFCAHAQPTGFAPGCLIGVPHFLVVEMHQFGWFFQEDIIWHKPNPRTESVKTRCTRAHEPILRFSKTKDAYFNHEKAREPAVSKGYETRGIRSVWETESLWKMSPNRNSSHTAPFPEELPRRCIELTSKPGDLVLDPFYGGGTTGKVAMELGRHSLGCELYKDFASMWGDVEIYDDRECA